MATIKIPGLVDAHVHLREPGYEHKEDFYSGSCAALAGGVTMMLDMPNTQPPTGTSEIFSEKCRLAASKAVCDIGIFVGATTTYLDAYLSVAEQACGLKIYVSDTFGSLRIDTLELLHRFFRTWGERANQSGYRMAGKAKGMGPIAVHAEELMLPVCLALSHLYDVPLHVVHVTRRSEIELIARAKDRGFAVTCEACPHHLFLSTEDLPRLGALGDMRPRLATPDDVTALWEHLAIIDVFATDHAPHTLSEKSLATPPPGVPGVETMLPLFITAIHDGKLTLDDLLLRCVENPRRVYGLPSQPDTWVDVEVDTPYIVQNRDMRTRVGWTPFAGKQLFGQVDRVVLRGNTVFENNTIVATPGSGQLLFANQ
ncbi:MAG: amidohydrolase family protein [Caldilineaceae bacterium]